MHHKFETRLCGTSKQMWRKTGLCRRGLRWGRLASLSLMFAVVFCVQFSVQKSFSISLLSADIHYTRHVPSYNVEVGRSLRLGIWIIFLLFLIKHAKKHSPPTKQKEYKKNIVQFSCQGIDVM
jgi:hypothetical protein